MSIAIKVGDPYGTGIPSPIPSPTQPGGEPIPAPGLPDKYPHYLKPIPVNTRDIAHVMRRHLNSVEPKVRRWLYSTWNASRDAIKYQELRNAVRDREVPLQWITQWQRDYVDLINNRLGPQWATTMHKAANDIRAAAAAQGLQFQGQLTVERVSRWIRHHGTDLAVALTNAQHRAVRSAVQHFTTGGPDAVGARELGRIIRPMIGLTPNQARAVTNYRNNLDAMAKAGEIKPSQVDHLAGNYAGRLHRIRAERIARTETAFSYNMGMLEKMRDEVAEGGIRGSVVKEFLTADDELVCDHCGPLNGQTVDLEETFPGATQKLPNLYTPPLHPGCRCAIVYQIIPPDDTE